MGLVILIPVSLAMGLCALAAYFWAVRSGQYDDLDGAAWRVLTHSSHNHAKDERDGKLAPVPRDNHTDRRL